MIWPHLRPVLDFEKIDKTLKRAVSILKPHKKSFDAIAVIGISGIVIGPILANKLKKSIIIIRNKSDKKNGKTHQYNDSLAITKYIFVDDLIETGKTFAYVRQELQDMKCVGVYLYTGQYFWASRDMIEDDLGLVYYGID